MTKSGMYIEHFIFKYGEVRSKQHARAIRDRIVNIYDTTTYLYSTYKVIQFF